MTEEHRRRVTEGHAPRAVTGGGTPQEWRSYSLTDHEGRRPLSDAVRPTVGPDTPSGVSSANTSSPSSGSPTSSASSD